MKDSGATVTRLPLRAVDNSAPDPGIIEFLEDMLARAKANEFGAVAVIMCHRDGCVGTGFRTDGGHWAHQLVAGAVYMLRRTEDAAGNG